MARVACFLLERADRVRLSLRKFTFAERTPCALNAGWGHDARIIIGEAPVDVDERGIDRAPSLTTYLDDARWPTRCHLCLAPFVTDHEYQVLAERLYRVTSAVDGAALQVGAETTLMDAPPGAMWNADWYPAEWKGLDGRALVVRLPNRIDWVIDSRAHNCDQRERPHHCWIRHGEPPFLTVDKRGDTCHAGAGSIQYGEYHGFLRHGALEACP